MAAPRWLRGVSVLSSLADDDEAPIRSGLLPFGPDSESSLMVFTPDGTPVPERLSTATGAPAWRASSITAPGSPFRSAPVSSSRSGSLSEARPTDYTGLSFLGSMNAPRLNNHETAPSVQSKKLIVQGSLDNRGSEALIGATTPTEASPFVAEPRSIMADVDSTTNSSKDSQESKVKAQWRSACEAAKRRQDSARKALGFKDRLADDRVLYRMKELWTDAIEYHGRYWHSIQKIFLLSTHKYFTPTPIASLRLSPQTGCGMLRKDVQIVLSSGMCRTQKKSLPGFHSLISFKANDIAAMFAQVVPNSPLMVLFMTKYEGVVVFFFPPLAALKVILILMQTKFVETLQCHIPENPIGQYAAEILEYCGKLTVEEEILEKQEILAPSLINRQFAKFFQNLKYPETDGWDSDLNSDDELYLTAFEAPAVTANGRQPYTGSKRRRAHLDNAPRIDGELLLDAPQRSQTVLTEEFLSASHKGQLEYERDNAKLVHQYVMTKKQREVKKLNELLSLKSEYDHSITQQRKVVLKTDEDFDEIEDRISKLSVAIDRRESPVHAMQGLHLVTHDSPSMRSIDTAPNAPGDLCEMGGGARDSFFHGLDTLTTSQDYESFTPVYTSAEERLARTVQIMNRAPAPMTLRNGA